MAIGDDLAPLNPENHALAIGTISELILAFQGKTSPQTPDQTSHIVRVGAAGLSFIKDVIQAAERSATLVPPYCKVERMTRLLALVDQFKGYMLDIDKVLQDLKDTVTVAKGVAYNEACAFYNSVQESAKRDVEGAQAVLDALEGQFERASSEREETPEPSPANP